MLGVLHKLVPDGDVDLAANALGDLAPVHVPARLLDGPHNLAEAGHAAGDVGQRDRASLGDERVGFCSLEQLDEGGVRLVVGNQDGREAVEGAGEQHRQELEAVGQVDGDALGAVVVQVLADDGNLLGDARDAVLRHALLAQDGHDGGGAAGAGLLLQRDLARDAAPDVSEIAVLAGRVHGRARRLDGEPCPQGVWEVG